jgi:small subunit ribosomal protein S20
LSTAVSVVAKSASKGLIHKNTAARKISRLTKRANAALQAKA